MKQIAIAALFALISGCALDGEPEELGSSSQEIAGEFTVGSFNLQSGQQTSWNRGLPTGTFLHFRADGTTQGEASYQVMRGSQVVCSGSFWHGHTASCNVGGSGMANYNIQVKSTGSGRVFGLVSGRTF